MLMARVEKFLWVPALAIAVATATAQTRPDFSGRWTAVPESPAPAGPSAQPSAAGIATMASIATIAAAASDRTSRSRRTRRQSLSSARSSAVRHAAGDEIRVRARRIREPERRQHGARTSGERREGRLAGCDTRDYDDLPLANPRDGKPMTTEVRQVFTLEGSGHPGRRRDAQRRAWRPAGDDTSDLQEKLAGAFGYHGR